MRPEGPRWRPVAGRFVQPPGVVALIEVPVSGHGPMKVVAYHGCDHVHDGRAKAASFGAVSGSLGV